MKTMTNAVSSLALAAVLALLSACAHAPNAEAPSTPTSAGFKEAPPGWMNAAPADALDRGPWWGLFNDASLDALVQRVNVSNQNVAAAAAAYAQAQALVREQRASLFPTLGLNASATRSGGKGSSSSGGSRDQLALA